MASKQKTKGTLFSWTLKIEEKLWPFYRFGGGNSRYGNMKPGKTKQPYLFITALNQKSKGTLLSSTFKVQKNLIFSIRGRFKKLWPFSYFWASGPRNLEKCKYSFFWSQFSKNAPKGALIQVYMKLYTPNTALYGVI